MKQVHRLTPILKAWSTLLAILIGIGATLFNAIGSNLKDVAEKVSNYLPIHSGLALVLMMVAALVLIFVGVWFGSYIWWKAMGYSLDEEEIRLEYGVISKTLRTARYDRIQAVDVHEDWLPRLFGLASVRVETAGGSDSVLEIAYLEKQVAAALRKEIIAIHRGHAEESEEVEDPGVELVPTVPVQRSLVAAAIHGSTAITVLAFIFVAAFPLLWPLLVPWLAGSVPWLFRTVDKSYQFRAELKDELIEIHYGWLNRRRQSIPLGRVHAVEIMQPTLWRFLGWWQVRISIAGYGMNLEKSASEAGTTVVLPVGEKGLAIWLAAVMLDVDPETLTRDGNPSACGKRVLYRSPQRARLLSPLDLEKQAVTFVPRRELGEPVIALHAGRIRRRVKLIQAEHVQELTLVRGPISGALGLANVELNLVPGISMRAPQLSQEDADELLDRLRQRKLPRLDSLRVQ